MPNRLGRHPLAVELLEPRVYLSAPHVREQMPSLIAAASAADDPAAAFNQVMSALRVDTATSTSVLVVLDVNSAQNPANVVLATFDRSTGELLGSVPVNGGQLILLGDNGSVASAFNFKSDSDASNGIRIVDRVIQLDATALQTRLPIVGHPPQTQPNEQNDPPPPPRRTEPATRRPPLVVVIPSDRVPDAIDPLSPPAEPADRRPSPSPPQIIVTEFTRWLALMSPSPWWIRTTDLGAVQSRLGALLSQSSDASLGDKPAMLADDLTDMANSAPMPSGARLLLRSPVRSLVFTTPRAQADGVAPAMELVVYNFETGQLSHTGHAVVGRLSRVGDQIAFLGTDWDQEFEASGLDSHSGPVLQLFNPATLRVRNTGISAEAVRVENNQIILGIANAAARVNRPPESNGQATLAAHRFDPGSGRLTDLHMPYNVTPDVPVTAREAGGQPARAYSAAIRTVLGDPSAPPKPGGSPGDEAATAAPNQGGDGSSDAAAGGE